MSKSSKVNGLALIILLLQLVARLFLVQILQIKTQLAATVLLESLLAFPCVIFLVWEKRSLKEIEVKPFHPLGIIIIPVLMLCLSPWTTVANLLSQLLTENVVAANAQSLYSGPTWMMLSYIAILPAVVEEFVCRGVLFHEYKKQGFWGGVLLSALFFGIMHLNFNQFCYAFVMGVFFAMMVEFSGSLFTSVYAHFLLNGFSVLMMRVLVIIQERMKGEFDAALEMTEKVDNASLLSLAFWSAGLGLLFLVPAVSLMICLARVSKREERLYQVFRVKKKNGKEEEKTEEQEPEREEGLNKKRERLFLDVFLVLLILIGMGFIVWGLTV